MTVAALRRLLDDVDADTRKAGATTRPRAGARLPDARDLLARGVTPAMVPARLGYTAAALEKAARVAGDDALACVLERAATFTWPDPEEAQR
jgi:hypothetical protein